MINSQQLEIISNNLPALIKGLYVSQNSQVHSFEYTGDPNSPKQCLTKNFGMCLSISYLEDSTYYFDMTRISPVTGQIIPNTGQIGIPKTINEGMELLCQSLKIDLNWEIDNLDFSEDKGDTRLKLSFGSNFVLVSNIALEFSHRGIILSYNIPNIDSEFCINLVRVGRQEFDTYKAMLNS